MQAHEVRTQHGCALLTALPCSIRAARPCLAVFSCRTALLQASAHTVQNVARHSTAFMQKAGLACVIHHRCTCRPDLHRSTLLCSYPILFQDAQQLISHMRFCPCSASQWKHCNPGTQRLARQRTGFAGSQRCNFPTAWPHKLFFCVVGLSSVA